MCKTLKPYIHIVLLCFCRQLRHVKENLLLCQFPTSEISFKDPLFTMDNSFVPRACNENAKEQNESKIS